MSSDDVVSERPVVAGTVLAVLVFVVWSALQFLIEGGVDVVLSGLFAVTFSAAYMGFYLLRERRGGGED